jgi:hypothetical protein
MQQFGLHPVFALLLAILLIGLSILLYKKTAHAPYLFLGTTLLVLWNAAASNRIDFLKCIFGNVNYLYVRLAENTILCLPVLIWLIFIWHPLVLVIPIFIVGFVFVEVKIKSKTLPTPYFKYPFEFIIGFRKNVVIILFTYMLSVIGLLADNYNLIAFALILLFLVAAGFYQHAENEYYVWIYSISASNFLMLKVGTACLLALLTSLPIIILMAICYLQFWYFTLFITAMGAVVMLTFILARYAYYPQSITLPAIVIIGLCLYQPLLFIFSIPFFYFQALKKIKGLLPC